MPMDDLFSVADMSACQDALLLVILHRRIWLGPVGVDDEVRCRLPSVCADDIGERLRLSVVALHAKQVRVGTLMGSRELTAESTAD